MRSAAQRRGSYGGEYLWAELRLCARGERRNEIKIIEETGLQRATDGGDETRSTHLPLLFI
jgi:hypothetical protein